MAFPFVGLPFGADAYPDALGDGLDLGARCARCAVDRHW
jgi:hypothetical protein